jgi:GNAT superfamily N-acetyltransferase
VAALSWSIGGRSAPLLMSAPRASLAGTHRSPSVLIRPAYRWQGLAQAVSSEAIEAARAEGLLPQWRARRVASQQLAQSLGLVRLGTQFTLTLHKQAGL